MRVKRNVSKNSISYSIIESYRDRNGRSTTRVVESLGNEEEIRRNHPGVDPEKWANEYARKLTEEKKKKTSQIIAKYNPTKQIPLNTRQSYNIGYLFLQKIYHELKFDKLCQQIERENQFSFDLNAILSRLLYMRILNPSSKRSTLEQAKELLEGHTIEPQHMYRALDVLEKNMDRIQEAAYKNSKTIVSRQTDILYYDCTNFFFEIEEADGLKQYGMSKEHRPNPIVQMGLFMDGDGLPLAYNLNPGNTNEQPTLKPLQKRIMKEFNLSKMIVITDAGLSSVGNRKYNTLGERGFVTTQSIKMLPKHLKAFALDKKGWKLTHATGNNRNKLYDLSTLNPNKFMTHTFYKKRWINEKGFEQRLIVTFSFKYQAYNQSIREKQIERAIKKFDNPSQLNKKKANDPTRFIESINFTQDGEVAKKTHYTLNNAQVEKEAQYDGLYGVCTNVQSTPEEIVAINHRRWEIEETFRIMKTEMKSRPVYLQKDERIQAHFLTCFLSLLIFRILEKKLKEKFTCTDIIQTLKNMRVYDVQGQGYIPTYTRTHLTDYLHETFGFRTDTEIISPKILKKIMKDTKKAK
ncbi:IS1634 family transposase [Alkalibacterium kapii]|uniref:Transposase n=1 Tax=Alkalibacterium kapii TaxID=426704 RepID=A0A511AVJ3_9LACT|nr:IS1634 family transposase [Alkalibacterium kapii]GEK92220.1 transposase [Alkalibacterium kapii]